MYGDQQYGVNVHKSGRYCCWYCCYDDGAQEYEEISEKWFHFVEEKIRLKEIDRSIKDE